MTGLSVEQALENIYTSLHNDNDDIDTHITALRTASNGAAVVVDPVRLPQNNRQGRKMMQAYFKKRGVTVSFKSEA
jgi:hypothetical protein